MSQLLDYVKRLPLSVRLFLFDALQGTVFAVFALNLAVPGSLGEAKAQALIIFAAIVKAVGGSFIRGLPAMIAQAKDLAISFLDFAYSKLLG